MQLFLYKIGSTPRFVLVVLVFTFHGSRTFFHRLFPHREFFQRHFSIGQMPTWIFTHHGFLPIMFCPSGKIPTWIYTHHNFAHLLVDFYPSELCPSENSSSHWEKPKNHQKIKISAIFQLFSLTNSIQSLSVQPDLWLIDNLTHCTFVKLSVFLKFPNQDFRNHFSEFQKKSSLWNSKSQLISKTMFAKVLDRSKHS